MERRGNCGAAPPGADEAVPQFPQPRRFASLSLYGEVRKRHCGKAVVRAEPGPARRRGIPPKSARKGLLFSQNSNPIFY